jgi:NADPH:quinone reductase-like Zn-dependent oxidoreductase
MRSDHKNPAAGTEPALMRAVVQDSYGSADVLRLDRIATPTISDDEVLVRVHAAGLDRGTEHVMTGKPYAMRLVFGLRRPRQPVRGRDVAGTVEAVGPEVSGFSPGDEVYGIAPGSFAEYAVSRPDKLSRKPANLTFEQAAVVPVSALTALQAVEAGRVGPGQRVLVLGASGGVGGYAVQLAKSAGAEVTGVCSTAKVAHVRALGADHVLDYSRDDYADGRVRYDVVLDIGGTPSLSRLRRALTRTGTAIFVGGENAGRITGMGRQLRGALLSPFQRQRLRLFMAKEQAVDLERLTALIEDGTVTPSLDSTVPLERAPEAMRRLAAGDVRGKVAITV